MMATASTQVSAARRVDEEATPAAARARTWTMMRIGAFDEALVRSLVFVLDCERGLDAQARRVLRRLPERLPRFDAARLARIVDDQAAVLRLDREIAIESLPALLPDDEAGALRLLETVASTLGPAALEPSVARRFEELSRIVSFAR